MKVLLKAPALVAFTLGLGVTASAFAVPTTLDFATLAKAPAAGIGEQALADGKRLLFGTSLWVQFNAGILPVDPAGGSSDDGTALAYLDGPDGGKPAGLGVCSASGVVAGGQCPINSDDNVTGSNDAMMSAPDEWVGLSFFDAEFGGSAVSVDLSNLAFRDANHNQLTSTKTLLISTNAGTFVEHRFGGSPVGLPPNAGSASFAAIQSIRFAFGGSDADQFYIESATSDNETPVPTPGLLAVMGLGLVCLGFRAVRGPRGAKRGFAS